jgi:glycosyltransferase involved in cell wall biosynthesis
MQPRILYLRPSADSIPLNALTATLLQSEFEDHDVQTVDIRDLVKSAKWTVVANIFATIWLYGGALLTRQKKFRHCFWRTPYIFRRIRELIGKSYGGQEWAFTFQIQSLFDGSIDGIPHYVYTDHTHLANLSYPGFDRRNLFSDAWIRCEKSIYENATTVFTMSNNMSRSVVSEYGVSPERVLCVYSGPNIDISSEHDVVHDSAAIRILFVGVDWFRKGGDILVDAFAELCDDYPALQLTIVGCVPPEAEKLNARISVAGRVPIQDVGRYFQESDIFCMPTRLEPFGIVFIEAMAYRLPIIATHTGALPDLVEDNVNGMLVESENVDSLVNALRTMIDHPELRQEMGRNGHQRYLERFNWPAVYSRIRDRISADGLGKDESFHV